VCEEAIAGGRDKERRGRGRGMISKKGRTLVFAIPSEQGKITSGGKESIFTKNKKGNKKGST